MSSDCDTSPAIAAGTNSWSRRGAQITRWRDWTLPVKLTAVVLIPMIFAVALGIAQIYQQVRQSFEYTRMDSVVTTADSLRSAANQLQQERTRITEFHGQSDTPETQARFAATDMALARSLSVLRSAQLINSDGIRSSTDEVERQIAEIPALRQQVLQAQRTPEIAIDSYSKIIDALLALDHAIISRISSPEVASTSTTLHELEEVGEAKQLQQDLDLIGSHRGVLETGIVSRLNESEARREVAIRELRSAASPQQWNAYDRLYNKPGFAARENSVRSTTTSAVDSSGQAPPTPPQVWTNQSQAAMDALERAQSRIDDQLHQTVAAMRDRAGALAILEVIGLLVGLLLSAVVVVTIGHQLLESLERLRRSALHTAHGKLVGAIADIRAGRGSWLRIDRVPVDTTDEIGQVARALEVAQTQAIGLVTEQAESRQGYRDSFVNVARRSQILLERQLRLFEQLERDEQDPDQLATLFQLDHLATRMRRNNENLMVLSGSDLTGRFPQPATPADLVRAAVSEIEHYPRVMVQPLPDVQLVGDAAGDLIRLLAELLDNAANFSAAETTVIVSGQRNSDNSISIEIVDHGIGMGESELAAANERLTVDREVEPSTSRHMGLFVVGRLASRHGIAVELHGTHGNGLCATIGLRVELFANMAGTHPDVPAWPTTDADCKGVAGIGRDDSWDRTEAPIRVRSGHDMFAPAEHAVHEQPSVVEQHPLASAYRASSRQPAQQNDDAAPTPIFDDLASAWFHIPHSSHAFPPDAEPAGSGPTSSANDARKGTFLAHVEERVPSSQPDTIPTHQPDSDRDPTALWSFTSDDAQRHAEEVLATEPNDHTEAGLSLRSPRTHLIAGSATEGGDEAAPGSHDADVARERLTRFQRGLQQGRQQGNAEHSARSEDTIPPDTDGNGSRTDWALHPDPVAHQAEAALNNTPVDHTQAGLPQRIPRAQLAPGTAAKVTTAESSQFPDADLIRGRLSSFQRGLQDGKHSAHEPIGEAAEISR